MFFSLLAINFALIYVVYIDQANVSENKITFEISDKSLFTNTPSNDPKKTDGIVTKTVS